MVDYWENYQLKLALQITCTLSIEMHPLHFIPGMWPISSAESPERLRHPYLPTQEVHPRIQKGENPGLRRRPFATFSLRYYLLLRMTRRTIHSRSKDCCIKLLLRFLFFDKEAKWKRALYLFPEASSINSKNVVKLATLNSWWSW